MARDGTITKEKLVSLLSQLPPNSRISTNAVGNLVMFGRDLYLGYLDLVEEQFWPHDEEEYDRILGQSRTVATPVSRFRTSGYEEGQSKNR